MVALEKISSDLKQTETKKTNLQKAFTDLHTLSSSLSSFSLTWYEINSHFSSIQSKLEQRYTDLVCHVSHHKKRPNPSFSTRITTPLSLKSFCTSMDAIGLQKYIVDRPSEKKSIRNELKSALQSCPDPATLILCSLDGFFPPNPPSGKDSKLDNLRMSCILLLEELVNLKPELKPEVREKAMELAVLWKENVGVAGEDKRLEAMGFLNLLAAYDIGSSFEVEEIIPFFLSISKSFQAIQLFRQILPRENVPDLISKLLKEGKEIIAVKYVFEFGLTEMFPPVPLLKAHVEEIKKIATRIVESGNSSLQSLNEGIAKEMSGVKQVIKIIEEKGLESEYPKAELTKRVEELEKTKAERKRASKSTIPTPPKRKKPTPHPRPHPRPHPPPLNPNHSLSPYSFSPYSFSLPRPYSSFLDCSRPSSSSSYSYY